MTGNSFAINDPEWAYLHLEMPPGNSEVVDLVTWKMALSKALKQFMGIAGDAISTDILHVSERESWIRVHSADLPVVWNGLAVSPIQIVRASQALAAVTGPRRGQW